MGNLKDRVAEPVSLPDRLKIGARRVRLASIGLISKVDAERARLYHQAMALGDSYGSDQGLMGQLTRLGTGTVNLVLEESQRLFDELVEAGEQALAGEPVKPSPAAKLHTPRPVAKSAPKLVANARTAPAKVATKTTSKPVKAAAKPALQEVAKPLAGPADDLRQRFEAAKARLGTLTSPPDQLTMLTLYALFKQATEGDVTGRRPGPTKLVERAKFDERHKIKGMTLDDAMERYIATVDRLVPA